MRVARDGFAALRWYDRADNGGNGDGVIDAHDAVFARLRLWFDFNADGISQPWELVPLNVAGVVSLETTAAATNARDEFGNLTLLASTYQQRWLGRTASRPVYDVYFVSAH